MNGYALRGLTAPRCPECGQVFDPLDPTSFASRASAYARRRLLLRLAEITTSPLMLIPATWLCLLLPFLGVFFVLAGLAAVAAYFYYGRRLTAGALLLGSPVVGYLAYGAFDYIRGEGKLRFQGLGGTTAHNVDPYYRCERVSTGCGISGNEYVTDDVYNFSLQSLISVFGPMRGAYVGSYPTRAEALAALANWQPVPPNSLMNDRIPLIHREVRLDGNVGIALLGPRGYWVRARDEPDVLASIVSELGPIQAVLHDGVLILRSPFFSSDRTKKSAMIALIDPQVGRPFAYYADGGYVHNRSPVSWRP